MPDLRRAGLAGAAVLLLGLAPAPAGAADQPPAACIQLAQREGVTEPPHGRAQRIALQLRLLRLVRRGDALAIDCWRQFHGGHP